ncbi:ArsR/SmtB family transcription factor [Rubrobacter aplysinae]|uniref:ArsR/SmtB family transcription factor n=1 Tax=Rubrobacter aplysinae TaxID=909625 RepID=UPI000A016B00|nr:metalloregulator ArsR/SmtB family transcription factor [Rubrobacter aplysinae]
MENVGRDRTGDSPDIEAAGNPEDAKPEPHTAPASHEIQEASDLLKVVGDRTRMRILCALLEKELSVSELQQTLEMGQSAVSHQLRTLRDANLVKYRREWKTVYYSLADHHVRDFLSVVVEHIRHD